jgi:alpha-tubulin suppressor-like RCC1 family protein
VWCWGAHHRGQLGDGTLVDRSTPVEVLIPHSERVVELATGEEHTCARMLSGRVYCWGSNHLAQLALRDPLWIPRAEQGAVRWPR